MTNALPKPPGSGPQVATAWANPAPLGCANSAAGMNSRLPAASVINMRSQVAYRRNASEAIMSPTPIATDSQAGSPK